MTSGWTMPLKRRSQAVLVHERLTTAKTLHGRVLEIPIGEHPGAFGVRRKHHTHEGIDLYAPVGEQVYAVESGKVLAVKQFTGAAVGSPWWNDTFAVWIEGETGVVVYGEICPYVLPGQEISAGYTIGYVMRVLKKDKGWPTSMLHLELHTPGDTSAPEWLIHEEKPAVLLDPTPHIIYATW